MTTVNYVCCVSLYNGSNWIPIGFNTTSSPTPVNQIDNIITSSDDQDTGTVSSTSANTLGAIAGNSASNSVGKTHYTLSTTTGIKENHGKVYFVIKRSGDTSKATTLNYRTEDITATASADYEHIEGSVTFAPGEVYKTLEVKLITDNLLEHSEKFRLVVDILPTQTNSLLSSTNTPALTLSSTATVQDDNPYINLLAIDSGFSMTGPQNARLGYAITAAGNVDGDLNTVNNSPLDDFFVSAAGDNNGQGSLYLVAGSNTVQVTDQDLDLEKLTASQGLKITGVSSTSAASPQLGYSMTSWQGTSNNFYAISAPNYTTTGGTGDSNIYLFDKNALNVFFKKQATVSINQLAIHPLVNDSNKGYGHQVLLADINNDGTPELIVGLPLDNEVRIYTLSGSGTMIKATLNTKIFAPAANLGFGSSFEVLDFNHDDHLDLAIGAPNANPVTDSKGNVRGYGGAIYLWNGNGSLPPRTVTLTAQTSTTNKVFNGSTNFTDTKGKATLNPHTGEPSSNPKTNFAFYDGVGSAIAVLDFNGDGILDLVVGAPNAAIGDTSSTATPKLGKVYVLFGGQTPPTDLEKLTAGQGVIFEGVLANGQAGYSVADAGDVNNDGVDDLLIGTPFAYGNAGSAYVAFGSTNAYKNQLTFQLDPTVKGSRVFQYQGIPNPLSGDNIVNPGLVGIGLGGVGDINGDRGSSTGGDDIVLGAPSSDDGNGNSLVYTAIGHPWLKGGLSVNVQDLRSDNGFILLNKNPALPVGDVNGDGFDDFINIGNATPGVSNQLTIGNSTLVEVSNPYTYNIGDNVYQLILKPDSLVLYNTATNESVPINNTPFSADAAYAVMQSDGNFVVYSQSGAPLWSTGTNQVNNAGSYLTIGVDGGLYLRTNQFSQGELVKQLAPGDPSLPQYTLLTQNPDGTPGKLLVNASLQSPVWNSNTAQLVASGDFNADGYQDIVSVINYGNSRAIAVNQGGEGLQTVLGDSTFTLSSVFPNNVQQMVTGDINGDGFADLVILSGTNNNYQLNWFLGSASGLTTSPSTSYNLGTKGGAIAVGDLNNDGFDEIAFLENATVTSSQFSQSLSQSLHLYQYNESTQILSPSSSVQLEMSPLQGNINNIISNESAVSLGDFNGDGYLDLLTVSSFAYNYVSVGSVETASAPSVSILYGANDLSRITQTSFGGLVNNAVAVGDVNGDGFDDILFDASVVNYKGTPSNQNLNWLQLGSASINQSSIISIGSGTAQIPVEGLPNRQDPYQINAAGDVNGDGYDDFLMTDPDNKLTYVVYGQNWETQRPISYDTSYTNTYSLTGTNGNDVFQIPTSFNQSSEVTVLIDGDGSVTGDEPLLIRLIMQDDGNLVLYGQDSPSDPEYGFWATGTSGTDASYAVMQTDGNLVLYSSSGQPIWSSRTQYNQQFSSGTVLASNGGWFYFQDSHGKVERIIGQVGIGDEPGVTIPQIGDIVQGSYTLLAPGQKLTNDSGITAVTIQGLNGDDYAIAPLDQNATYLFNGGEGDDTLGLPGTNINSITNIDGGSGFDTLFLPANLGSNNSFDLTKLNQRIRNIEQIDLGNSNNLVVDKLSLLKITDSNKTLIINGTNSTVKSNDPAETWNNVGSDVFNGKIYDIYNATNSALNMWIQQDGITVQMSYLTNMAPTGINLIKPPLQLVENTVIGTGIKVADVNIVDDSLGTNNLFLTGADKNSFEIRDNSLFYVGDSPDFERKSSYNATLHVDDPTVGNTPDDASTDFTLTIANISDEDITFALATDSGSSNTDGITNVGTLRVSGLEAGGTWQYSLNAGNTWTNGAGTTLRALALNTTYAVGNIQMRQTDVAGNVSTAFSNATPITIDLSSPLPPTFALGTYSGSSNIGLLTNVGVVSISGQETGASWQYSTNSGGTWTAGTGTTFTLSTGNYALNSIQVRQIDLAGNITTRPAKNGAAITVSDSSTLDGSVGNRILTGSSGNDTLIAGTKDILTGLGGDDNFRFNSPQAGIGTITDFGNGNDKIQLQATGFGGGLIAQQALTANQFFSGAGITSASTSAQRLIYNTTNGALYFDSDGNGSNSALQIATLSNQPLLGTGSFSII